jgi:hypothetical protein
MEHRGHAIEKLFAGLDLVGEHIAPGDGDAESRTRLSVGPGRSREPREPVTALALIALRDVQRHRAERPSELLAQIAVMPPNAANNRRKDLDRMKGQIENLKGGCRALRLFSLHAPPSDRSVPAPQEIQ